MFTLYRCLAARNCYVGSEYLVKLAHFRQSRLLTGGKCYDTGEKFVIKYTDPDAIISRVFTSKSDIWCKSISLGNDQRANLLPRFWVWDYFKVELISMDSIVQLRLQSYCTYVCQALCTYSLCWA